MDNGDQFAIDGTVCVNFSEEIGRNEDDFGEKLYSVDSVSVDILNIYDIDGTKIIISVDIESKIEDEIKNQLLERTVENV